MLMGHYKICNTVLIWSLLWSPPFVLLHLYILTRLQFYYDTRYFNNKNCFINHCVLNIGGDQPLEHAEWIDIMYM
jgi:hypothetical protein